MLPHAHSKSSGAVAPPRLPQNGSDVIVTKATRKSKVVLRAVLTSGSNCSGNMLEELGLIGTIGEDDEVPVEPESDSGDEEEV